MAPQPQQNVNQGRAYDRVILDESKREFGYLGAKVDGMGCVAFSMANDLSLELGKILKSSNGTMGR